MFTLNVSNFKKLASGNIEHTGAEAQEIMLALKIKQVLSADTYFR